MTPAKTKKRIDFSGYYFIGLIVLVIIGFWPSYFSKFFNGTADFNFYFHFHAGMMFLWILVLIAQPILIRKKKVKIHRLIGKLTYFLMPLLFISILLLVHSNITGKEENLGLELVIPFKDLLILGTMYLIAIWFRRDINIHARAMIAAGIVFIEPALVRFVLYSVTPDIQLAYPITISVVYLLLIGLMIAERKQKRGRWVFPLTLGLYIIVHSILVFQIHIGAWESFSRWFVALPLT